jgi:hypothetical protein
MTHCSSLGEVAAANVAEVRNMGDVEIVTEVVPTVGDDEMHAASDDEGHASTGGRTDNSTCEKASDDENSWAYNFEASTITLGRIMEMAEKGYFAKGEARAPGAKTVPEPEEDEVVVYKDFLSSSYACFRILLWRTFVEISNATPTTDTKCDCAAFEVFLGCRYLRRRAFG